jgi:ferrous iron transport protein A
MQFRWLTKGSLVIIIKANDNYYQLENLKCCKISREDERMTLHSARIGITYTVNSLELDIVTMRRLEALGLTRGTRIKILNRNRGGSVILMVRGSRLAIGRKIAESIQMREAS